ncbi:pollen-specific leucine-rich repeat extensin-like protein 1 [Pieris napi]|uniref:pollen-specific leucine-rich repeat extensin-like protein 1 n=1 Tax=Pieris napi TaxID=78633 RepID=UPI001FB93CD1|nr:pollen-specific leucine-rich repeat extensin-like protein 1 [Pieris napi]
MHFGLNKWTIIFLIASIRRANVQMAYPFYMPPPPPPIIAMPPPMPIPIFAIEIPEQTTKTTTTTTERSVAIAIPVPVPMPVQVAVPAYGPSYCVASPRPKGCPPCPPCLCMPQCTPAFFSYCSPCHQKCRCRSPGEAPVPLPPIAPMPVPGPAYPMPAAPPVMVVPMPPIIQSRPRRRRPRPRSCSEESSEETSDSSDCDSRRSRKFKRRRLNMLRKRDSSDSDREVVRPVLTYVSNNGDVRYEKKISNIEADQLLGRDDGRRYQTMNVITREDAANKQQVVVMSDDGPRRYKQVMLRNGVASHVLSSGKKELVFQPPDNKRISNLSVSFQIA